MAIVPFGSLPALPSLESQSLHLLPLLTWGLLMSLEMGDRLRPAPHCLLSPSTSPLRDGALC